MEAKPFINKHHKTTMAELAKQGSEMYHSVNPHLQEYKLGELSLSDGVPIPREAPYEQEV